MYAFKLVFVLVMIINCEILLAQYIQNYEQALLLSSAVVNEIQEQIIDIESKLPEENPLTSDPSMNKPLETPTPRPHPISFLSGRISDKLINRMADYLYSLLQGTGEVIKPTHRPSTSTTTAPTPSTTIPILPSLPSVFTTSIPFSEENLLENAVLRQELNILDQKYQITNIRRKPVLNILRKMGVSRKKSDKLWNKSRRRRVSGRV